VNFFTALLNRLRPATMSERAFILHEAAGDIIEQRQTYLCLAYATRALLHDRTKPDPVVEGTAMWAKVFNGGRWVGVEKYDGQPLEASSCFTSAYAAAHSLDRNFTAEQARELRLMMIAWLIALDEAGDLDSFLQLKS